MLTVVTGAPCSGKSTYVVTHAKPGDLIIDYDRLAQALGVTSTHDHPPALHTVTLAARRAALFAAIDQHHQGATVWVVDAQPGQRRLAQFRAADACIVALTATPKDKLHERAARQGRPAYAHRLIDEWVLPAGAVEVSGELNDW